MSVDLSSQDILAVARKIGGSQFFWIGMTWLRGWKGCLICAEQVRQVCRERTNCLAWPAMVLSMPPKRQQEEETMRDDIYWVCVFKLEPSRLDDFKNVVRPLVEMTRKEEGSMAYEYHVSADHTEIHIIEHYRSSAAVVHHVTKTFSQFAEPFTAIASVSSFIVYGTPNAAAKEILDGFGAVYLTNFDGFTK